jgi:pimeloyl-ACP methyl ester carboxylesterase
MNYRTTSEIATYFRVCDGTRVRYADTKAESDTVILMLAPWPETLWAFRRVWGQIRAVGRVIAIEMPGFGHSDQPERLIAPDAMGEFLALLIDEWDLGAPHSVGPDVGTAAALFLAVKAPQRVTSLSTGGGTPVTLRGKKLPSNTGASFPSGSPWGTRSTQGTGPPGHQILTDSYFVVTGTPNSFAK